MPYAQEKDRNQEILFPPKIEEYVKEKNPVRLIDAFVEKMDLSKYGFLHTEPEREGRPRYSPRTLLKLYIYGYVNKVRSSRKLEIECLRNIEVIWLLCDLKPDYRTIADFRKENKEAFKKAFDFFVEICIDLNLYTKQLLAVDGSKFRAVNSKDRNFTKAKLKEKLKRISEHIDEYLKEMDKADTDEESGTCELTKDELEDKIKRMEERSKQYEEMLKEMEENNETQKSLTDPDSRLMKTKGGFEVCHNAYTVVDKGSHLIADFQVTGNCTDKNALYDNAQQAKEVLGEETVEILADNGFENKEEIEKCLMNGIYPHVNPDKNSTAHEIEVDYEEAVITEEEIKSKKPEDIQKCLKAGVIPEVYQHQDIAVEITEVTTISKSDKCFKLNEDGETVTCPEGEILNKVANLNKKQATRYVSKAACSHCENKCTTSDFKQVDFKDGQKSVYLKNPPLKKRIVRITIKPDKEKLKERKSIVEHPFGTIKRWNDGSYLLLVGNKGATADLALLFLGYNIKRAINMVGIEKIMEAIEQKG